MPDRIGYSAQLPQRLIDPVDFKGFSRTMSEREDEHFDIDDEFLGEAEESHEFDPLIERAERRPKAAAAGKRGKAFLPNVNSRKSSETFSKTINRSKSRLSDLRSRRDRSLHAPSRSIP
jgi:hypothetical protein